MVRYVAASEYRLHIRILDYVHDWLVRRSPYTLLGAHIIPDKLFYQLNFIAMEK